jgi:hypothetical protein
VSRTQGSAIRALDIGVMLNSVCMHMSLGPVRIKCIPRKNAIYLTSSIESRADLAKSAKIAALQSVRLLCVSRFRCDDGWARGMLRGSCRYNSSRITPIGIKVLRADLRLVRLLDPVGYLFGAGSLSADSSVLAASMI